MARLPEAGGECEQEPRCRFDGWCPVVADWQGSQGRLEVYPVGRLHSERPKVGKSKPRFSNLTCSAGSNGRWPRCSNGAPYTARPPQSIK